MSKWKLSKRPLVAVSMTAALAAGVVGCSGGDKGGSGAASPSASSAASPSAAASAAASASATPANGKIVSSPLTLSYFVQLTASRPNGMNSLNDMEAYKELEKITGIHVDFKHPASGQETNQFNLMMSSGDYPDVIEWNWAAYPGGGRAALDSGAIVKLNDYIDKYAPNLKKLLTDNPDIRKQISTDNGDIYSFPFLRNAPTLQTYFGLGIRKDWLDKLGLQVPTTIDEWHAVLKAFKEKDPNGNGKADELPLLLNKGTFNWGNPIINAWGIRNDFYLDNGKVQYGALTPQYKEFLATMRAWYKEGLIDPDYAATDAKQKTAKVTGELVGAMDVTVGGGIGTFMNAMKDKNPAFNLAGAPYPTLKKGDKPVLGQMEPIFNGLGAAISKKNKNVVETVKWLDYKYGQQGSMLFNFGVEGKSYTMVNGFPTYTDDVMKNKDGLAFGVALTKYAIPFGAPISQDTRYMDQNAALPQQKEALQLWTQPDNKGWLPTLSLTSEEASKFATIMNDVKTYNDEMFDKFIMGAEPIENFDKFVEKLNKMNVQDAVKIEQAAYERYLKR
ncbi:type 2 periplasmic-binding domain-containing protein [Paenibacillus cymbidii]|uniref:extracellular solute-binding protein n=1 Tax=Paenibacillus cymbidii TaxID=1639034 RepID=UPI001F364058|nr:extracellular solute-binding protein [Paenibacillus cymbidii]